MIASRPVASSRQIDTTELARRAQKVLDENRRGAWTFSPLTGRGYGAPDFSWTAALALELLAHAR